MMENQLKYEVVVEVVQHATMTDTPDRLAARVRRLCPRGTYEPVRICEDLRRIVNRSGQFTSNKVRLSKKERGHASALIENFKQRGLWVTRRS